jgi:hypothetical protein
MPGLMSGDWKRSTVLGPQRLQPMRGQRRTYRQPRQPPTLLSILLYVERWLNAPLQQEDGTLVQRDRGTPQGSSISPLLTNLFLHYVFDMWIHVDEEAIS